MKIGFIGLGKMGGNMVLRLALGSPDGAVKGGHQIVGFATDPNKDLAGVEQISIVPSLAEVIQKLPAPHIVWVMVPAGQATEGVIAQLADLLSRGDIIIDGGNSYYKDSVRRAAGLAQRGLGFLDVGTSGGIWGRQEGYCMMVGGQKSDVDRCRPIFDTLAPKDGWQHFGASGAGHFVKMVHNGIEYGIMQAYGEGFEVLFKSEFKLDLHQVAKVWNHGSVVRSWLLELAERALETEGDLKSVQPYVADSGEGRWTLAAGIEHDIPMPVIAASLFARFVTRDPYNFAARLSAALRNQFGGHAIQRATDPMIAKK